MAENRDAILADFQARTGIDDIGESFLYLEETNWDLLAAVNKAMPRGTQQLPSEMGPDIEMLEEVKVTPRSPEPVVQTPQSSRKITTTIKADAVETAKPGTSTHKSWINNSQLTFHINHLNNVYKINLSESSTFGDLKQLIWQQTNVPPCQQYFHGWVKELISHNTSLEILNLGRETTLYMLPPLKDCDLAYETVSLSGRMTQTYILNVKDEVHNKTYKLKFLGTRTVLEVKTDVYSLIDVPVLNQQWKGWPSTLKDDNVVLAQSGICHPEHDLSVGKLSAKEEKKKVVNLIDIDSSIDEPDVEELEDVTESFNVEDDIFIDDVKSTKVERLMPENVVDEVMGTLHFAEQFEKQYGPAHPEFFAGTFEDALKESCLKSAKERKLLAVYLHHDNSVLANVFCTQPLGFETVLQLLSANFIVWGWDITYESNKERFLYSVTQTLGTVGSLAVTNIDVDTLPALMIIMRSRSNTEIFTIVHGNVGVNELLTNLVQAVDVFQEQRRADIGVEEERQARERVKQEQDKAYQESLAADRAKEEAKQMQEQLEKKKKEQAENERLAEQARKEAHRQAVESSLPSEPDSCTAIVIANMQATLNDVIKKLNKNEEENIQITEKFNNVKKELNNVKKELNNVKKENEEMKRDMETINIKLDMILLGHMVHQLRLDIIKKIAPRTNNTKIKTLKQLQEHKDNIDTETTRRIEDFCVQLKTNNLTLEEIDEDIKSIIDIRNSYAHPNFVFKWNNFNPDEIFPKMQS